MNTQCYFCHQVLINETAQQHSSTCGYVLEPCVNKCGAYIPRNTKAQHSKTCRNNRIKSSKSVENLLGYDTFPRSSHQAADTMNYRTGTLPRNYQNQNQYQPVMPDTMRYDDLKGKFQLAHQQHSDVLRQLEYNLNKLRGDIQTLQAQNHTLVEWRTNVQFQLDSILQEFRNFEANNKNDANTCRLQEAVKDLAHLRNVLNSQQVTLKNEQVEMRQFQNDMQHQVKEVRNYFVQELGAITTLAQQQNQHIDRLTVESATCKKTNDELLENVESLKKEVDSLKAICDRTVERDKLQDAQIVELKRSLAQINLDVEVTERSFENIQGLIATQAGRLVWKIGDFNLKMENAKANEKIPIKSPVFYTSDYGYRVRLVVFLNGLKKWRGRHLLACMHVMKGEYDDLLKWPCKIEANILLRDLAQEDKPKDFVRYITAKRNYPEDTADDPQESSTQYIFIPHATLLKKNHLKNDAFYLEILVNN